MHYLVLMNFFDDEPTEADLAVLDTPEVADDFDAWMDAMLSGPEDF